MLSLFRSSPRGPRTPRFFPPPDDTYASLLNLLRAPAASSSHLSLLEPATLYGSIAHYFSTLPLEHVPEFARTIAESQCLWDVHHVLPAAVASAEGPSKNGESTKALTAPVTLLDRARNIADAVAGATVKRAELIVAYRRDDLGWQSRRLLSKWINAVTEATRSETSEEPSIVQNGRVASLPPAHATRIIRLSILSGILAGLQATRAKKRQNAGIGLSVRYHERAAEDEWIVAFAEGLEEPARLYGIAEEETAAQEQEWEKEFRQSVALRTSNSGTEERDPTAHEDAQARLSASVPLFLASQVMPHIKDSKLSALPSETLIICFADTILALLDFQVILRTFSKDVVVGEDGVVALEAGSGTAKRVANALESPLFAQLGPLSRVLSNTLARVVSSQSPLDAGSLLLGQEAATRFKALTATPDNADIIVRGSRRPILERFTERSRDLKARWISSALAGLEDSQIAERSRPVTKNLWTLFKTFLFSQTMIYDTLIESIVDMCPSPTITLRAPTDHTPGAEAQEHSRLWPHSTTSNLPRPYLAMTSCVLRNFGHLFWMTATFGTSPSGGPRGFEAYRKAFYSSLDVLSRDGEACVSLLEDVAPRSFRVAIEQGHRHAFSQKYPAESNSAVRSDATYFLDVSEQLMSVVPDDMVELVLLPTCRAYLERAEYVDAYESAHSAVLAVFEAQKRVVAGLAPYYLTLLLESYPKRMSAQQLEVAMGTVVSSASDHDDAAAWWCLTKIQERIEADLQLELGVAVLPAEGSEKEGEEEEEEGVAAHKDAATPQLSSLSDASSSPLPAPGTAAASPTDIPLAPTAESSHSSTSANPTSASTSTSTSTSTSLPHIYVSQLPFLNLVLLRSALAYTRTLILRAPPASAERNALCERTFTALGGLNASTREEGLRWWLDRRAEFGV